MIVKSPGASKVRGGDDCMKMSYQNSKVSESLGITTRFVDE